MKMSPSRCHEYIYISMKESEWEYRDIFLIRRFSFAFTLFVISTDSPLFKRQSESVFSYLHPWLTPVRSSKLHSSLVENEQ